MLSVAPPQISIIVPLFNERSNIDPLFQEIREAMNVNGLSWEILFVDDGSTDGSSEVLHRIRIADDEQRIRILTQSVNRGQGAALYRGFNEARGQIVVTMDGDRQNHPADFPRMLQALDSGTDMVVGIRRNRQDSSLRRRMSRTANAVRAKFLGDGLIDSGCALKVMRRAVIDSLIPLTTLYSFIPALAIGGGHTVKEMEVTHRPRIAGASSYGLRAMLWRPIVDMLGIYWLTSLSYKLVGTNEFAARMPSALAAIGARCY
ncbi:MAG: dolichol-phosphate mannosyltransferase [Verrucomicrobiales bacterium]|jgi:dolichol-phosphate mannosyltransferase